ncbi:MAG: GNAT family N-acetyltransferase, partial [Carbonactinosporaceae bacterium]
WTAHGLWTEEELAEPARYVHRMIIDRIYAGQGLGTQILEWVNQQAKQAGARWLRVDVWTDNTGLHRYYLQRGFTHVRTVRRDDYPSGALFQRPVS